MTYTPPAAGSSNWDVPLNVALADLGAGNGATVSATETTTSTTYTDLDTVGPTVSITLTESRFVLLLFKASLFQVSTTDAVYMSVDGSGSLNASDFHAVVQNGSGNAESFTGIMATTVSAGTTTFTAKYRTDGGTGSFADRVLAVVILT